VTTAIYISDDFDFDKDYDEFQVWHVYAGDDDGEPTGKTYTCHSYSTAFALGQKMAADRGVELVTD